MHVFATTWNRIEWCSSGIVQSISERYSFCFFFFLSRYQYLPCAQDMMRSKWAIHEKRYKVTLNGLHSEMILLKWLNFQNRLNITETFPETSQ